jgi:hypothetical protein
MNNFIRFKLQDGRGVIVQVDDRRQGQAPVPRTGEFVVEAAMTFEQSLSTVRPIAEALIEQVRDLGPKEGRD